MHMLSFVSRHASDCADCQGVAQELLHAVDDQLEASSLKIKRLCYEELRVAAANGMIHPSGLLRAILISGALLLRLDIQELESLNSMIKMAVLRSQTTTMSLELLCSRVCVRKIMASLTGGSTRFKDVVPIASSIARSCYLHWDKRVAVQDDPTRFATSVDIPISDGHCKNWNPSLLPSASHNWAKNANSSIVKALKQFKPSAPGGAPAVVIAVSEGGVRRRLDIYMLGEVSRSIGMLVKVAHVRDPRTGTDSHDSHAYPASVPLETEHAELQDIVTSAMKCSVFGYVTSPPRPSLFILAELYDQLKATKHTSPAFITELVPRDATSTDATPAISAVGSSSCTHDAVDVPVGVGSQMLWHVPEHACVEMREVCSIRYRKEYARKSVPPCALGDDAVSGHAASVRDTCHESHAEIMIPHTRRHDVSVEEVSDASESDYDDTNRNLGDLVEEAIGIRLQALYNNGADADSQPNDGTCTDMQGAPADSDASDDDLETALSEAIDLNDHIAAKAAAQHVSNNQPDCNDDDGTEHVPDAATHHELNTDNNPNSGGIMNAYDMEQEEWLRQVLLDQGFSSAGVTVTVDDTDVLANPESELLPTPNHRINIHEASESWRESLKLSASALRIRATTTAALGENRQVSLMLRALSDGSCSVDFVQWSNVKLCEGRILQLDSNNGIVCPLYFMQSSLSLAGAQTVHPACGVTVRKVKKAERPQLADEFVRLQHMFRVASKSHTCEAEQVLAFQDRQLVTGDVCSCTACGGATAKRCACCLLGWHDECADATSMSIRKSSIPENGLCLSAIPEIFVVPPLLQISPISSSTTGSAPITRSCTDCPPHPQLLACNGRLCIGFASMTCQIRMSRQPSHVASLT